MEVKLSIIVMSHLSDVQQEIEYGITQEQNSNRRINFVKWLINKYGDLTVEVNADKEWEEFKTTRFY